jgi:hypothetical protein
MSVEAPTRCSALADALAEPMIGTVDHRVRWLLVEDRGAWGEHAVRDALGAELEAAAKARSMRLLLVRRREADPEQGTERMVFLVDTGSGTIASRSIGDVAELHALLDAPIAAFGAPSTEPMFLVCTNGRRDACCALRGRALVASLAVGHGDRTWECTHLGGHRFAGNLVCLPDGIIYGRVGPADGPRLADRYLAGRIDVEHLRGRSAWPAPAQVAERAFRARIGADGLHEVALTGCEVAGDRATVELTADGRSAGFVLAAVREGPPRPISCRADGLEEPLHWRVETTTLAPG